MGHPKNNLSLYALRYFFAFLALLTICIFLPGEAWDQFLPNTEINLPWTIRIVQILNELFSSTTLSLLRTAASIAIELSIAQLAFSILSHIPELLISKNFSKFIRWIYIALHSIPTFWLLLLSLPMISQLTLHFELGSWFELMAVLTSFSFFSISGPLSWVYLRAEQNFQGRLQGAAAQATSIRLKTRGWIQILKQSIGASAWDNQIRSHVFALFANCLFVENLMGWHGLGQMFLDSLAHRDRVRLFLSSLIFMSFYRALFSRETQFIKPTLAEIP